MEAAQSSIAVQKRQHGARIHENPFPLAGLGSVCQRASHVRCVVEKITRLSAATTTGSSIPRSPDRRVSLDANPLWAVGRGPVMLRVVLDEPQLPVQPEHACGSTSRRSARPSILGLFTLAACSMTASVPGVSHARRAGAGDP